MSKLPFDDPFEPFGGYEAKKPALPADPFAMPAANVPKPQDSSSGFILTPEETTAFNFVFKVLDTEKNGAIGISPAATFLLRSKLSSAVLREIWDLSDTEKKGALDKTGLFKALKYVAVAQSGKPLTPNSLNQNTPLPVFEGISLDFSVPITKPISVQNTSSSVVSTTMLPPHRTGSIHRTASLKPQMTGMDLNVTADERTKFKMAFQQCAPVNGLADGTKTRALFLRSNLSAEILAQIWTLVDNQAVGKLNQQQFCIAMFMITRIKSGHVSQPPNTVPDALWKLFDEATVTAQPPVQSPLVSVPESSVLLDLTNSPPNGGSLEDLSGIPPPTAAEKAQSFQFFESLDTEKKGFVTGQESYEFFLKSSLPQPILAGIWNMCDKNRAGKLDKEQFAYAIHLIRLKKSGRTLPFEAAVPAPLQPQMTGASQTAPIVKPSDPMMDLLSLDAPTPTIPAALPPALTGASQISGVSRRTSMPVRDIQPMEQFDLMEKEKELAKKRVEVADLQSQLKTLQPATEDLKLRKDAAEFELKSISDQKNQLSARYSQLRATVELETQIVADLEASLARERQLNEAMKTEMAQLEKTSMQMSSEKAQLVAQVDKLKQENTLVQTQLTAARDTAAKLQEQVAQLKAQVDDQQQKLTLTQQALQVAQTQSQQWTNDAQALEKMSTASKSPAMSSQPVGAAAGSSPAFQSLGAAFTGDTQGDILARPDSAASKASSYVTTSAFSNASPMRQPAEISFDPIGRSAQTPIPLTGSPHSMKSTAQSTTHPMSMSPGKGTDPLFSTSPAKVLDSFEMAFPSLDKLELNTDKAAIPLATTQPPAANSTAVSPPSNSSPSNNAKTIPASVAAALAAASSSTPPPLPPSNTKPSGPGSVSTNLLMNIDFDAEIQSARIASPPNVAVQSTAKPGQSVDFSKASFDAADFDFDATFGVPAAKTNSNSAPSKSPEKKQTDPFAVSGGANPFSGTTAFVPLTKDDPFAAPFPSFAGSAAAPLKDDFAAAFGPMPSTGPTVPGPATNASSQGPAAAPPATAVPAAVSSSNMSLNNIPSGPGAQPPRLNSAKKTGRGSTSSLNSVTKTSAKKKGTSNNDDPQVQQLMNMGFTREKSLEALNKNGNDLQKAADYLLGE